MYKKIGHGPSGGQIVKFQKISVFIMLSCWISSNNGNRVSRPKCTFSLQIVSLNSSYIILNAM